MQELTDKLARVKTGFYRMMWRVGTGNLKRRRSSSLPVSNMGVAYEVFFGKLLVLSLLLGLTGAPYGLAFVGISLVTVVQNPNLMPGFVALVSDPGSILLLGWWIGGLTLMVVKMRKLSKFSVLVTQPVSSQE